MITQLFYIVFKHLEGDALVEEDKTVERLAKEFATKVLKLEFSPAEICHRLSQWWTSDTSMKEEQEPN